uniref:B30.2/SPRY domain-containing protein n=1 Tax=Amphiprion percula TaxID=161767 RepID=A0A3P8T8R7_AMPPE
WQFQRTKCVFRFIESKKGNRKINEIHLKHHTDHKMAQKTELQPAAGAKDSPKTREEFLKYSREITLDPNTASTLLLLSDGDRKATVMKEEQLYPDHPDRFTGCCQVLSRESLTGRCYWEVQWSDAGVSVAVAYKDIRRAGNSEECEFGYNDRSWALECSRHGYEFFHDKNPTLASDPRSCRVGVYLDHGAGVLSFYSVNETMKLLHRVQTRFSQPLLAGLWLYSEGTTAEFCKLT